MRRRYLLWRWGDGHMRIVQDTWIGCAVVVAAGSYEACEAAKRLLEGE